MALGQKRVCYSCAAKFYDLEQDPAKCPKCGIENMLDGNPRTKKGRKALAESVNDEKLDDIEIELDEVEELEDIDEDGDDMGISTDRDKIEVEDGDSHARDKDASPEKILDLEGDHSDIIGSGDEDDIDPK